jgi:hypothetical protein
MNNDKPNIDGCAKRLIDFALDPSGHDRVYGEMCQLDSDFKKVNKTRFLEEFVPAKLALGCGFWVQCCEVHGVGDKEERNVFFRKVVAMFQSPSSLPIATRFSEYLHAANIKPEESPLLSIATALFEKLHLKRIAGESATSGISNSFILMMEISDAFKNAFENEFDDLWYSGPGSFRGTDSQTKGNL